MKKLPIGYSSLEKIIENNCVYIDKSRFVKQLAESGGYYFLSRPRRFGKSLFIDTLKQAFLGNKEVFKGLYLENDWDWNIKYPVVHISFASNTAYDSLNSLLAYIKSFISFTATECRVEVRGDSYNIQFSNLIYDIFTQTGLQVVILIDEYDKPILDVITDSDSAKNNREVLKGLYSCIKDNDKYIKFVFLTGVTKFSKVSLFSGLNNLQDITINPKYSDICGYTQEELDALFANRLDGVDKEKLKLWYNGYNFGGTESQKVYNPFDILLFFANDKQYRNYWFETATPTFLIELLKKNNYYVPKLEKMDVLEDVLNSFDIETLPLVTLMFQSGYLTIKESLQLENISGYTLTYPNLEVKASLNGRISELGTNNEVRSGNVMSLSKAMTNCNLSALQQVIYSFFASIPHDWYRNNNIAEYEGFYSSIVYSYFCALGYQVIAEDTTNSGKIDMTIIDKNKILVFEFKVIENCGSASALEQIKEKKYHEKYLSYGKPIYIVGVNFSSEKRNITEFRWEKFDSSGSGNRGLGFAVRGGKT